MKTVKFYKKHGGNIVRLPEKEAAEAVKSGKGIYCPKNWLKKNQ